MASQCQQRLESYAGTDKLIVGREPTYRLSLPVQL